MTSQLPQNLLKISIICGTVSYQSDRLNIECDLVLIPLRKIKNRYIRVCVNVSKGHLRKSVAKIKTEKLIKLQMTVGQIEEF